MDPSDFPSPFDPLTLPEKPLAGDLPVDMEFGEDLLESQTAPTRGWAPPGPSPSSGALDLLDTPAGLEKDPGVLDGATELLGLGGLLYKAPSPPEVDHGPEGTLAWDAGDQTLEPGPGGQTPEVVPPDPGAGANSCSPEGLLEPLAPDSPITLQSPHIEEEETTSIATARRGSPGQEEELPQGQPQSPNAPPSPSVGETLGDGINSSQTKPGGSSPPAHPSLPGDGLTAKASEKPPERVQKRSERVRRAEPPKPEVVDSTESRRSGTPRTRLWRRLVLEAPSMSSAHPSVSPCMRPSSSARSPSLGIPPTLLAAAYARRLERSCTRSAMAAWYTGSAAILASPNSGPTRD
ncbi:zinc finger MYM-type containing 3 [Homo sapiens]|uniref:Zinc finger MYM-type containing 3 n=2 Tax=Homo sapiens TaxID=9606 RepID=A6NC58_HUMAN|nr:zinc finger MYM-type containing 3 [Homo sapiens]KAI4000130.1 zinc finger MYM-type containing 3 [Homo sapiens]